MVDVLSPAGVRQHGLVCAQGPGGLEHWREGSWHGRALWTELCSLSSLVLLSTRHTHTINLKKIDLERINLVNVVEYKDYFMC